MIPHALNRYFLASLLCGVTAPVLANSSPAEVFEQYVKAANKGDMATIAGLIAPDVARSDFVGCKAEMDNPTCLLHYIKSTVVDPKSQIQVTRLELSGDVVDASLQLRGELTKRAGVERIIGRDVVRVEGGLIKDFHFIPDFTDESTAVFFGSLGIGPRASKQASQN